MLLCHSCLNVLSIHNLKCSKIKTNVNMSEVLCQRKVSTHWKILCKRRLLGLYTKDLDLVFLVGNLFPLELIETCELTRWKLIVWMETHKLFGVKKLLKIRTGAKYFSTVHALSLVRICESGYLFSCVLWNLPSVRWHCWLGNRNGIWHVSALVCGWRWYEWYGKLKFTILR